MRQHKFANYYEYRRAQRRGSMRRSGRSSTASAEEIRIISDDVKSHVVDFAPHGICHGARCGTEVQLFRDQFPESPADHLFGTDLIGREKLVLAWDFSQRNKDWVGQFDFIYTNSLDHASNPKRVIRVWLEQLKPTGRLYVTWSTYHKLDERELPYPGGDCFGASLEEYVLLLNKVGRVVDVLFIGVTELNKLYATVVVERRKPKI